MQIRVILQIELNDKVNGEIDLFDFVRFALFSPFCFFKSIHQNLVLVNIFWHTLNKPTKSEFFVNIIFQISTYRQIDKKTGKASEANSRNQIKKTEEKENEKQIRFGSK